MQKIHTIFDTDTQQYLDPRSLFTFSSHSPIISHFISIYIVCQCFSLQHQFLTYAYLPISSMYTLARLPSPFSPRPLPPSSLRIVFPLLSSRLAPLLFSRALFCLVSSLIFTSAIRPNFDSEGRDESNVKTSKKTKAQSAGEGEKTK